MSNIVLENGKYTVVRDGDNVHALRHGESWRDLTGNKLVGALCARIDALTLVLDDLREAAVTLRRYEASHRAKGTDDSHAKAEVNCALAARFEETIAKVAK